MRAVERELAREREGRSMTTSEEPKAATEAPEAERPSVSAPERKPRHRGVIQAFTALCVRYVERLMPDPYLFAVILTVIVAALVALYLPRTLYQGCGLPGTLTRSV